MFDFNKNAAGISRWVILGILGLFLLFFRQSAKSIVYAVFAIGLMLAGVASVVGWWQEHKVGTDDLFSLGGGVALFIFGIWIFRNPGSFDRILNMIAGVVLVICGINWMNRNAGANGSKALSILSIVAIVAGIIIAFSHAATNWVISACGIGLIYTAVTGYISEKSFRS